MVHGDGNWDGYVNVTLMTWGCWVGLRGPKERWETLGTLTGLSSENALCALLVVDEGAFKRPKRFS